MILEPSEFLKTQSYRSTYQNQFHNIVEHHPNHLYIFIDGFKDNDKTASKVILSKKIRRKALPKESSIFSAEACTIYLALEIPESNHNRFFYIIRYALGFNITKKNKIWKNPKSLNSRVDYTPY